MAAGQLSFKKAVGVNWREFGRPGKFGNAIMSHQIMRLTLSIQDLCNNIDEVQLPKKRNRNC